MTKTKSTLTSHSSRRHLDGQIFSTLHADRNFTPPENPSKTYNIDSTLSTKNIYWNSIDNLFYTAQKNSPIPLRPLTPEDKKLYPTPAEEKIATTTPLINPTPNISAPLNNQATTTALNTTTIDQDTPKKTYHSFHQAENIEYNKLFSHFIDTTNSRNIKNGHKELNQTIAQYKEKNPPEELIIQIGSKNSPKQPTPEELKSFAQSYLTHLDKYKSNIKVLNIAIHLDEPNAASHIHIRQTYKAVKSYSTGRSTKEDPKTSIDLYAHSQTKALESLGFRQVGKKNKYNNPKKIFSAELRQFLTKEADKIGFQIVMSDESIKGLELENYKIAKNNQELKQTNKDLAEDLNKRSKLDTILFNQGEVRAAKIDTDKLKRPFRSNTDFILPESKVIEVNKTLEAAANREDIYVKNTAKVFARDIYLDNKEKAVINSGIEIAQRGTKLDILEKELEERKKKLEAEEEALQKEKLELRSNEKSLQRIIDNNVEKKLEEQKQQWKQEHKVEGLKAVKYLQEKLSEATAHIDIMKMREPEAFTRVCKMYKEMYPDNPDTSIER